MSIYENGSSDDTAAWLQLLGLLLGAAGVPASVVTNGTLVRNEVRRAGGGGIIIEACRQGGHKPAISHLVILLMRGCTGWVAGHQSNDPQPAR